jgi:kynurenine formamidase
VGEAVLVDLPHIGPRQLITIQDLEASKVRIKGDDIVLVRTGYSDRHASARQYHEYSPGFSIEALRWLAGKRIKLLGTDTASLVRPDDRFRTVNEPYVTLFTANVFVVESLQNLGHLSQERMFFAALPVLSGWGLDASPARAVAIEHFRWS